jgi:hypothetical protein
MTIKQYGGVFGRNPTFNNVTVDGTGTLTVDQILLRKLARRASRWMASCSSRRQRRAG